VQLLKDSILKTNGLLSAARFKIWLLFWNFLKFAEREAQTQIVKYHLKAFIITAIISFAIAVIDPQKCYIIYLSAPSHQEH
jgi:hypothetical protein